MLQSEITGQMVIPTVRFLLRPVRASDLGLIEMFGEDERLAKMTTHIPHPLPPGTIKTFLDRVIDAESDEQIWAIDGSADGLGELLGIIALKTVTKYQSEINYWIAPSFWNSGIASEVVPALIAANPHNSRSLVASVFQDNPASAKILTKIGFVLIGESEVFSLARGAMVDTWDYVMRLHV